MGKSWKIIEVTEEPSGGCAVTFFGILAFVTLCCIIAALAK